MIDTNNTIFCLKYKKNLAQLNYPPIPGELGEKIYNNISAQAWGDWLNQQTMLINENKLILANPKSRKFLLDKMQEFLFN